MQTLRKAQAINSIYNKIYNAQTRADIFPNVRSYSNSLLTKQPIKLEAGNPTVRKERLLSSYNVEGTRQYALQESNWVEYCGQPNSETHAHMLAPRDIIPGFSAEDYKERRRRLVELLKDSVKIEETTARSSTNLATPSGVFLVRAAYRQFMAPNIPHLFRQNSDFMYLTGCNQPEALLVITFNGNDTHTAMFLPPVDNHTETWEGPQLSPEAAVTYFDMDAAFPLNELPTYFTSLLKQLRKTNFGLFYDKKTFRLSDDGFKHGKWVNEGVKLLSSEADMVNSPTYWIQHMRVVKEPKEIELMRTTCQIASNAFIEAMKATRDGVSEHQIEAVIEYNCKMNGASYLSYPPVVASGPRASIIHYGRNDQLLSAKDLLLVDAGCDYFGYCSDITRTWPIRGKFSSYHDELYQMLMEVQEGLIEVAAGRPSLDQLFQTMCRKLGKGLKQLEWPAAKQANASQLHKLAYSLCPHHVGHYLGMDVHDCGQISRNVPLGEGVVFTIEPGVYINANNTSVPLEFRGMGIRIEDDVAITSKGLEILTRHCPKTIQDIEACMKTSL